MPYPRKNLNPNETVALDMHPHWWFFAKQALALLVAIVVGIVIVATGPKGDAGRLLHWLAIVLLIVAALWLVGRYLKWITTNFVITSHRLIWRQGVFAKSGIEIPLDRINNVNFGQGILERILGAGNLLVESGGEDGQSRFTDIRHPDRVQNLIHEQMEGHAFRRAGYGGQGDRPAPPDLDVADQLERLEGMLQRGTLTPEEFRLQKQRLLGS